MRERYAPVRSQCACVYALYTHTLARMRALHRVYDSFCLFRHILTSGLVASSYACSYSKYCVTLRGVCGEGLLRVLGLRVRFVVCELVN